MLTRIVLIFLGAMTLAADGWAHPELVAQIQALDLKLQQQADDPKLLLQRGDLYRRHQDYAAAARDFAAAGRAAPHHDLLDLYLGRLRYETGDAEAAELHLQQYLSRNPVHAMAWKLRGEVSIDLNEPALAADYFDKAIEQSKSPSPELHRLKIMALVAAGELAWPAAIESVERGLRYFGMEITLLGVGTDIALAAGNIEEAKSFIAKLPETLRKLPQWFARIETLNCLSTGDETKAVQCRQEARNGLAQRLAAFLNE